MASYYGNILEEELKNRVAEDWFSAFDASGIIGKIDFSVAKRKDKSQPGIFKETEYYMWAESKQGTSHDIYESFVQLILTIGKARTFDKYLPPLFLGAFDAEKIAFIPYSEVMDVFSQNDFNWNVTPSNHESKEFLQLQEMVKETLTRNSYLYYYTKHEKELKAFIRNNFKFNNTDIVKVGINKNNFTHIYQKWLKEVKPSIDINWDIAKKEGLIDADFYLADILSRDNKTIKEKLYVLLESNKYRYNIQRKATGALAFETVEFADGQKAHTRFWQRYERPPKEEYWDYIVERRDLLVPQDIRERKGSFFTPQKWVELSQEYLAKELGEDWQDEYYIWDCCGGTGNMENGLTNKYNVWVSTLDAQDVRVMHDLIGNNGLNLLYGHVFQFDFLNDSFDKLPKELKKIIDDPEERKKLVIYINPPYAEAGDSKQFTGTGKNKTGVSNTNIIHRKYKEEIKTAAKELFALFFIRIYHEIPGCMLAEFSTLKILQAQNFQDFRNVFKARLKSLFLMPANTFDNVKGQFPIGFHIWDTSEKQIFKEILADVYNQNSILIDNKTIFNPEDIPSLNKWIQQYRNSKNPTLGILVSDTSDFQHNNHICIGTRKSTGHFGFTEITVDNIVPLAIYFSARLCIDATWLNDRDQFLYPNDTWKEDYEFQSDCLAYALFHGQNRISAEGGTNHWIPFTEEEVDAKEKFKSHFMSDFINGKIKASKPKEEQLSLFEEQKEEAPQGSKPIEFSPEAKAVMDAGRELWRYYHTKRAANPNAAFYDIRLHFQGVNEKGKMNTGSEDERYTELIKNVRECLKVLGKEIEPKVYEHGFLLK